MALRLIEAYIPGIPSGQVLSVLEGKSLLDQFHEETEEFFHLKVLVTSEESGAILDLIEERFSHLEGFRIMVLPVEATLPRPPAPETKPPEETPAPLAPPVKEKKSAPQVAREELYNDVEESSKPSGTYLALVVLSSIVAAIGILRDNTAVIIGAMVIAPLLGPNVALALATTLADWILARRALKALGLGIVLALAIAIAWGMIMDVRPDLPGMAARIQVTPGDIGLALASGCAGVLAYTTGAALSLVGVMVAVALLPPLITGGLLLGSGYYEASQGALLVFLTNVICVNLSGIVTFLWKGVQPLSWWEAQRAKRATRISIALWIILLVALFVVIRLAQQNPI